MFQDRKVSRSATVWSIALSSSLPLFLSLSLSLSLSLLSSLILFFLIKKLNSSDSFSEYAYIYKYNRVSALLISTARSDFPVASRSMCRVPFCKTQRKSNAIAKWRAFLALSYMMSKVSRNSVTSPERLAEVEMCFRNFSRNVLTRFSTSMQEKGLIGSHCPRSWTETPLHATSSSTSCMRKEGRTRRF